jgi:hypothetical protein
MTEDTVVQVQADIREIRKDVKDLVKSTGDTMVALTRIEERVAYHSSVVKRVSGVVSLLGTSLVLATVKAYEYLTK